MGMHNHPCLLDPSGVLQEMYLLDRSFLRKILYKNAPYLGAFLYYSMGMASVSVSVVVSAGGVSVLVAATPTRHVWGRER